MCDSNCEVCFPSLCCDPFCSTAGCCLPRARSPVRQVTPRPKILKTNYVCCNERVDCRSIRFRPRPCFHPCTCEADCYFWDPCCTM